MIRFPEGRALHQILAALEVRNPPTGEAHDHIRLRMLDVDCVEIATQVPGRWAMWRYCQDVEGDPEEVVLASPALTGVVRSMASSESITLQPDPEGLNVVQGLQVIDGRTVLLANRIVGVYPDDPEDFLLPEMPATTVARLDGPALRDAVLRTIKFATFGLDDTRTCLLRVEPNWVTIISSAKEADACLLAVRVPALDTVPGTWVLRGPVLSYWKSFLSGEVTLKADAHHLGLQSSLGGVIADVPPTNRLLEARAALFDNTGTAAPIPLGRRVVEHRYLMGLLKTQLPTGRDTEAYRRNLVIHPYRGGVWLYRPGRPQERAIIPVQGLSEESRLMDLATEFHPVAVNGPGLVAAANVFVGYTRGTGRETLNAALLTLEQVYTLRRPSGARVLIVRLYPASHPDPDLCVALVGDDPEEVPELDDFD